MNLPGKNALLMSNMQIWRVLALVGFGAVMTLSATASAQVYQWKDAEGRNVFSDSPPPGGKARQVSKGTEVEAPKSAVTPAPDAGKKNDAKKSAESDRAEKAAEAKRQAAVDEYCESARARLTELESGMRIGAVDSKGERYIMTDEQRAAEGAKLRRGMQEAKCP